METADVTAVRKPVPWLRFHLTFYQQSRTIVWESDMLISPAEVASQMTSLSFSSRCLTEDSRIYEEIRRTTIHLLALRSLVNQRAPVHRLSNELLLEIFAYLAHSDFAKYRSKWYLLTHTCRHWREVALQCPSLWTTVLCHNQDMAITFVSRSRRMPLRIVWETSSNDAQALADRLQNIFGAAEISSDVESLDFTFSYNGLDLFRKLADWRLPNLRSLKISHIWDSDTIFMVADPASFAYPLRLHTLDLKGAMVPLSSPYFSKYLRVLRLDDMVGVYETVNDSDLLRVLEKCPCLEEVYFYNRCGAEPFIQEPTPTVRLPLLRVLSVIRTEPTVSQLLSHISGLEKTQIDIHFNCCPHPYGPTARPSSFIPSCLQEVVPRIVHTPHTTKLALLYRWGMGNKVELTGSSVGPIDGEEMFNTPAVPLPRWQVSFQFVDALRTPDIVLGSQIVTFIGRLLPSSSLQELTLSMDFSIFGSEDSWRPIFRTFPNLRKLSVTHEDRQGWQRPLHVGVELMDALTPREIESDRWEGRASLLRR